MKLFFPIAILTTCLFSVFYQKGKAQCSGNVLFSENFGGNASSPVVGSPLPAGITSYTFNGTIDVNDGQYSIRKTTANLTTGGRQFNAWHIGTDRSGTGNMMIVNADYTAGKFYETRVDNLCLGSKLYFSAWIANLIPLGNGNPLDPVLKFEITSASSGAILSTFITQTIPRFSAFTWTQYGVNFTLPPGESSVILRIFNNQVGGLGNDLCLDDIEFSLCGPAISPVLSGTYNSSSDACVGSNLSFAGNVTSGFYTTPTYQWQFNDGANGWINIPGAITPDYSMANAQVSNSGTYRLLVAEMGNINSVNCRAVSPLIPVNIYNPVTPVLQSNQPLCEKDTLRISATSSALQYLWKNAVTTFPSTNNVLLIPAATLTDAGTYTLDVITNGGCSSSTSINIAIQPNQLQRMLPPNTLLCDTQTLDVDAQQPLAISYLWSDGSTSPQQTFSNAGTYTLVTSDAVCKRSDSFTITRSYTPSINLGNDTTLCYNELVLLNASHPLADTYLWSTSSIDSSISVNAAGIYTVVVANQCGTVTDDISIQYQDCADVIFVPNVFTPNDDRLNDVLKAKAYFRIDEFNFKIFNRWGQLIFSSNTLNNGWDGKIKSQQATPGMYVWMIEYKRNNKTFHQKGTVLLIY